MSPSGFKLSSLDAKLEQVTGGNSTSFLDYTYEDNPVGRIKVQVNKNASFQEAEAQEEEAGGISAWKILMVVAAVIILILAVLILFTTWCRRQRRRRRRGRRRRRP